MRLLRGPRHVVMANDRIALFKGINDALRAFEGTADEKRHLLDVLGFVNAKLREAQQASCVTALLGQVNRLAADVEALKLAARSDAPIKH